MSHAAAPAASPATPQPPGAPMWLLAELTYKCPLQCVFCSKHNN